MSEIIEHQQPHVIHDDVPMTAEQIHAQVQLIQRVMLSEMQDGIHYGTIPGCGDKPALLKAGADKLCMTFRFAPKYEIEDLGLDGERRYIVRARLYSIKHGLFLGEGIGEASTLEDKYAWEKASDVVYDEMTDPTRRRIKHYQTYDQKQVRANIADRGNTVLKMGKKRALVDAILTVTACSDMFSQDLDEDDVASMARQQGEQQSKPPASKAKAEPQAQKFAYGKEKGKLLSDPTVTVDYLQWFADQTAAKLTDPNRVNFRVSDQLFLASLDAEIAARKKATPQEQPKEQPKVPQGQQEQPQETTKPPAVATSIDSGRKPFTDASWAEFLLFCEEEAIEVYKGIKEKFLVTSGHDVKAEHRIAFYDQVMAEIAAQKK